MEILKRGTVPSEVTYKGTCHGCGSVVRALCSELQIENCPREGTYRYSICPVCHNKMYFNKEK